MVSFKVYLKHRSYCKRIYGIFQAAAPKYVLNSFFKTIYDGSNFPMIRFIAYLVNADSFECNLFQIFARFFFLVTIHSVEKSTNSMLCKSICTCAYTCTCVHTLINPNLLAYGNPSPYKQQYCLDSYIMLHNWRNRS